MKRQSYAFFPGLLRGVLYLHPLLLLACGGVGTAEPSLVVPDTQPIEPDDSSSRSGDASTDAVPDAAGEKDVTFDGSDLVADMESRSDADSTSDLTTPDSPPTADQDSPFDGAPEADLHSSDLAIDADAGVDTQGEMDVQPNPLCHDNEDCAEYFPALPPCQIAVCDQAEGKCEVQNSPDDSPCDDADVCTVGDTCLDGQCASGPKLECDDGNPCTDDLCDVESGCYSEVVEDGVPCDDEDLCTMKETCQAGVCSPLMLLVCVDDGDVCTGMETCDPVNGCQSGVPLVCEDSDPCTVDSCDPVEACSYEKQANADQQCHDIEGTFAVTKYEAYPDELEVFGQKAVDGTTYYAWLDGESDDTYSTFDLYCYGGYHSGSTAWDIERNYIDENTYNVRVHGSSDLDCGKGQPQCTGVLELNDGPCGGGWKIAEVSKCNAGKDTYASNWVLIPTFCNVDIDAGTVSWQAGSTCGGCCACPGGGSVDIDITLVYEPGCPLDMVCIVDEGVCIDKYEASEGPDGGAVSAPEVMPWTNATWFAAKSACELAGKRLCKDDEWISACSAGGAKVYPYGNEYTPAACNGVGGVGLKATGSMGMCEGGYPGLFDMSGNLYEWVDDCDGEWCRLRGGSFLDDASENLKCDDDTGYFPDFYSTAVTGFRCCK